MNKNKKLVIITIIALMQVYFTSCTNKEQIKDSTNDKDYINKNYSEVIAGKSYANNLEILNITNNIQKVQSIKNISNISYNNQNKIFVYSIFKSHGKNLTNNYIQIYNDKKGKSISLKNDFSYMDIKLSKKGNNIAYRSFVKDSYDSVKGLSIYSISNNKNITLPKNIIVSGNLYNWVSDNEIWYYGVDSNKKNFGSIYAFDVEKNINKVIYENFNGYCTYFMPYDNEGILYLENNIDKNSLFFYDIKQKKAIFINNEFDDIYDAVFDKKTSSIFFIGSKQGENNVALYSCDIKNFNIKRVTYDLPSMVDKNGGIGINNKGQVYFCGFSTNERQNDIYMYDISTKTNNLLTQTQAMYHVYSTTR